MFNPELDGKGKVEPLKQHRQTVRDQITPPKNTALADALRKAEMRQVKQSTQVPPGFKYEGLKTLFRNQGLINEKGESTAKGLQALQQTR